MFSTSILQRKISRCIYVCTATAVTRTGNVSGLLVYAKTQAAVTPDCLFNLGGNLIGARTLDLNQDFRQITAQLDEIAQQFFGKYPL